MQACGGELARRFAREASEEFDCVLWVPCQGRSLVQAMGELGAQLGLVLDGQEKQNRQRIHELLARRRCLMVLDAPSDAVRSALTAFGRSSTLVTTEAMEIRQTPHTLDYARRLVRLKRFAEAYDLLCALMEEAVEPGSCARELAWICEHWSRTAEAERWRQFDRAPTRQMGLFE